MSLAYRVRNFADVGTALRSVGTATEREAWPRERLDALQQERTAALVEYASTHSPFYRRHYGGRVDRRDVAIGALPPVTKAMMMDHFDEFLTDPALTRTALERHLEEVGRTDELFRGEYRVMASSGSSGRKGLYVYDRAAWRELLGAALRMSRFIGMTPRFPRRRRIAQVAAPDAKHMTSRGASSMAVGVFRSLRLSATDPLDAVVAALDRHRPEVLMGYPSVIAMLAAEQLDGRLHVAPASICTTSEVRTPEMTARIRAAWGVEPFDCLGLTESGITAVDCAEHAGLHVFEDTCRFEVVDAAGRAVPPGTPGEKVLVTNLGNRTQPFIRFEVTDLVTVTDAPCPCGRTFRRITAIEGRSDDVLEVPAAAGGAVRVHPIHLRSPLAAMAEVAQYQIAQTPDALEVTLALVRDAVAGDVARGVERKLAAALHAVGAAPLPIRVRVVARIPRETGAGKFKLVKAAARPAPVPQPA